MSSRAFKWIVLPILIVLSAGCSRVQFFYNQMDWLVPFYLESYIDLDDEQYAYLETEVAVLLKWHCSTQLRGYADLLREANEDFQQRRMTAARMEGYSERLQEYWIEIVHQSLPAIAELLRSASDEQVEELFQVFEERNEQARERYAAENREELLESYRERMTEELERWFDTLTPEQADLVVGWSSEFNPLGEDGLAFRKRWQDRLRSLLAQPRDSVVLQNGLEELFLRADMLRSPAYQARLERNGKVTVDLVVRVGRILTPEQLQHLADTVNGYASDFEELACEAEEKEAASAPAGQGVEPR